MTNTTKFAVIDEDGYIVRVWGHPALAECQATEMDRLSDEAYAAKGQPDHGMRHDVREVTGTTVRGHSFHEDRTRPLRVSSRPGWDIAWPAAAA